jgi:hypothetical protein
MNKETVEHYRKAIMVANVAIAILALIVAAGALVGVFKRYNIVSNDEYQMSTDMFISEGNTYLVPKDFFELGSVTVSYIDDEGKKVTKNVNNVIYAPQENPDITYRTVIFEKDRVIVYIPYNEGLELGEVVEQ